MYIEQLRLLADGSVMIFLSDGSSFEYDLKMQMWRQLASNIIDPSNPSLAPNKSSIDS